MFLTVNRIVPGIIWLKVYFFSLTVMKRYKYPSHQSFATIASMFLIIYDALSPHILAVK
jgi:hypothetical protein